MDSVTYLRQFESCDDIGNGDFRRIHTIADEYAAMQSENDRLKADRVDLERFRRTVNAYRNFCRKNKEEADRLLALIDGQANVRSRAEHSEPALIDRQAAQRQLIARQLAEWHEDDGPTMWWAWCGSDWAGEPAWCGTPNDSDWPGYHTHWTPHPAWPMQPSKGEGD